MQLCDWFTVLVGTTNVWTQYILTVRINRVKFKKNEQSIYPYKIKVEILEYYNVEAGINIQDKS